MFKPVDPKPKFANIEETILGFWKKQNIFAKSVKQTLKGKPFVFYEGPPTANAAPGIHHVEARAFKDLYPRYQTMRGRYVLRKAGWDTHGLPVELQIEKKLEISGKKQIESLKPTVNESIAYFNKLCRDSVWQFKEHWEKLTSRMGFWIDLEHPYVTYENEYIAAVWNVIKTIWDKQLLYLGHKVVPYCPRCGTALSSHEVAQGYETVKDNSVYVKFKLKSEPNTYILSWTTTPWTLPGNVALAVGKNISYSKIEANGEFYIASQSFIEDEQRLSKLVSGYKIVEKLIKGKDLVGLEYEPIFDIPQLRSETSYKVYPADFVTTGEGTGVVHTAVMYGEDDYELGEKLGLPKHHTVDEEGKFTKEVNGLSGLKVKDQETEQKIFQILQSKNTLLGTESYQHEYPHCWRCGTALLYYARSSWFIKMSAMRSKLLKNNQKINWVPEHIKEGRFGEWLKDAKDWAISRERYWGTPLPIWQCQSCSEIEVVGSIKELQKHTRVSKLDLHRPYVDEITWDCKKCKGNMARVPEVMDVWFDSGSMPFAQGTDQFPADFISEAIDQTRGWFYTLLAISTLLDKGNPYKNVVCLGHVLDERGKKMSKSKGNVVDPNTLGDKYGFDIIRWYFYSVNQPGDPKLFSEKDLQTMQRRTQNILWNVYSYFVMYANVAGWKPSDKAKKSKNILDEWLLARLEQLVANVTENLDKYDAFHASREIEGFIDELSTWYLRRSRGRSDAEFYATLHHALLTTSKLLAPFMPFISESMYQNLKTSGKDTAESVHLAGWPKAKKLTKKQESLLSEMNELKKIVEEVHAMRAKAGIKLRQPLAKLTLPSAKSAIREPKLLEILKDEVNVQKIESGKKLELDTKLTEELKLAGLTRELERQIQGLRKESGLQVGQEAELHYQTESAIIKKAMEAVDKQKTYLVSIQLAEDLTEGSEKMVENQKVRMELHFKK